MCRPSLSEPWGSCLSLLSHGRSMGNCPSPKGRIFLGWNSVTSHSWGMDVVARSWGWGAGGLRNWVERNKRAKRRCLWRVGGRIAAFSRQAAEYRESQLGQHCRRTLGLQPGWGCQQEHCVSLQDWGRPGSVGGVAGQDLELQGRPDAWGGRWRRGSPEHGEEPQMARMGWLHGGWMELFSKPQKTPKVVDAHCIKIRKYAWTKRKNSHPWC